HVGQAPTSTAVAGGRGRRHRRPLPRGLRVDLRPIPGPVAGRGCGRIGVMIFDVTVEVRLRPGIADPQGATIERSLPALGFEGVSGVSVGKSIRFTVDAADESTA